MNEFVQYVPRLLGAGVLLLVGLLLAFVLRRSVRFLLGRLRFDELCERVGVTAVLGEGRRPTQVAGTVIFYVVALLAVLAALAPLGLDSLSAALDQVILYAPRALAAVLVLLFGVSAAGVLSEGVARALSGVGVSRTGGIKTFARFALIFVVAILAAAILEIDVSILVAITVLGLGAVALTASLALGLGLRDLSGNIAAGRYLSEGLEEGDGVSINGVAGTIERIGHAMTTIRSPDGRVFLVPNSHFLEHVVEKRESSGRER